MGPRVGDGFSPRGAPTHESSHFPATGSGKTESGKSVSGAERWAPFFVIACFAGRVDVDSRPLIEGAVGGVPGAWREKPGEVGKFDLHRMCSEVSSLSGVIRRQHESMMVLSWQSAEPPPPSLQLATGVVEPVKPVTGSFDRVIHLGKSVAHPPPAPVWPAIGWQTLVTPRLSVTNACIRRADPLCESP